MFHERYSQETGFFVFVWLSLFLRREKSFFFKVGFEHMSG